MATRVPLALDDLQHGTWQRLLAPISSAFSALTGAQLSQNMDGNASFTNAIEVLDIHSIAAMEIAAWAAAAANDTTGTIELYGWPKQGFGRHLGTLGLIFGNFQSAANSGWHTPTGLAHQSVYLSFSPSTAYRGCDTYNETADYYGGIVGLGVPEADFPSHAFLTFANDCLHYLAAVPTLLPVTASTTLGVVFRTVALKQPLNSGYL